MAKRSATPTPEWVRTLAAAPLGHRLRGLGTLADLAYAPDGERLATAGNLGVVVWHLRERRVLARLAADVAPVVALALSPDGTRLAALGQDDTLALCDLARGVTTDTLRLERDDDGATARLQFSPDGRALLVMTEEQAWLVAGGRARRLCGEEAPLGDDVQVAGFTRAGELVALGDGTTILHDLDLRPLRELPFPAGAGLCATSDDGRFLVATRKKGGRSSFAVVSLETGDTLATLSIRDPDRLSFAARAPLLLADRERPRLYAFPERPGAAAPALPNDGRLPAHDGDLWALAPAGDVVAVGDAYHGTLLLQPIAGGEPPPALGTYVYDSDSALVLLALDPRGASALVLGIISDGQNSSAWVQGWDLADDRPGPRFTDEAPLFGTSAAFVPGTDLVAVPQSRAGVLIADRRDDSDAQLLYAEESVQCLALGQGGAIVAAGTIDGHLILWHRTSGRRLARLQAHREQVCGIAWQPDGDLLATTSEDGTLRLWSAAALLAGPDPRPVAVVELGGMLYRPVFSADGSRCAVATAAGDACVVRCADGHLLARPGGHPRGLLVAAFHPGGELLTGGADGRLRVWDADGARLAELSYAPGSAITGLAFDAAGRTLALSHASGALRLWDLPASGHEVGA